MLALPVVRWRTQNEKDRFARVPGLGEEDSDEEEGQLLKLDIVDTRHGHFVVIVRVV